MVEFMEVRGFRSRSIGEMSSVSEVAGSGLSRVRILNTPAWTTGGRTHQSDVFVDRLYPPIRSSRHEQFRMYEFFHGKDDSVLDA